MKFFLAACAILLFCTLCSGKDKSATPSTPVTVPATIDHNRVVIEVEIPLPDGSRQRTRAWVDNGDPDLVMSRHLATVLGLAVSCGDNECISPPPREIFVGGMALSLAEVKHLRPVRHQWETGRDGSWGIGNRGVRLPPCPP